MDKLLFVIGASSDMGCAAIKEVGGQYRTVVAHYLHMNEKLQALKAALKAHGISEDIDAFMTLAFVSLPVIPKLRLNTYGIVDVDAQRIVPAVF